MTLVALFVLAAGWRLLYIARIAKSPLAGSMFDDARIYWAWSERIANGDLVGANPFFLAPLYPYLLGLLRALLGHSPTALLAVQALWGALAVALLADAVRRVTRPAIGVVVGVVLVFYEMAVFFDGLFLTESLLFCLASFLIWWIARFDWTTAGWRAAALAGVVVGLLAAGRATMALVLLPVAMLLRGHASANVRMAVLFGGFVLVVAPISLHNYVTSREWIPFTYSAGFNLYAGNNPQATGTFVPITGDSAHQPQGLDGGVELDGRDELNRASGLSLTPSGSSAHWGRRAWEYMTRNPGSALRLAAVKLAMLWNAREYPQIENVEEYRGIAGPVGLPVVGRFALLGALALVGAVFAWNAGPVGRFVLGYALVVSLATSVFFVTGRYRHQLIPACAMLAGIGIQGLWPGRSRAGSRWTPWGALVAGLILVHLPAPGPTAGQSEALLARNKGERFHQSALLAARSGRLEAAERDFAEAVRVDPRLDRAWGGLIRIQVQLGRTEQARESFVRARAAGLSGPAVHAYEALFAALSHDVVAAEAALRRIPEPSLRSDPDLAEVVAVTRRIMSATR